MLVIVAALLLAMTGAEPQDFLGKTITDVRVEIAGVAVAESGVLELVETRVGEPLAMQRRARHHRASRRRRALRGRPGVRVRHRSGRGAQVAAGPRQENYEDHVSPGTMCCRMQDIRRVITDRFGATPSTNRISEMALRLTEYYRGRGYEQAVVLPRVQEEDPAPEESELVLTIEAGPRLVVGAVTITGKPLDAAGRSHPPARVAAGAGFRSSRAR